MHAQEWLSYGLLELYAFAAQVLVWYCVVRDDQRRSYIYITLSTSNIIHLLHHYHVVLRGMLHSNILHIVVYGVECCDVYRQIDAVERTDGMNVVYHHSTLYSYIVVDIPRSSLPMRQQQILDV